MTKIMREKLERILERRGLSQAELERLAGLAENRIAKLKAAKRSGPSAAEALRVARVLRVPMEWLCDDAATHDPDHIKPMLAEWEAYVIDAIRSAAIGQVNDLLAHPQSRPSTFLRFNASSGRTYSIPYAAGRIPEFSPDFGQNRTCARQ